MLHAHGDMRWKGNDTISISQTFELPNKIFFFVNSNWGKESWRFSFVFCLLQLQKRKAVGSQVAILIQPSIFVESHCMRQRKEIKLMLKLISIPSLMVWEIGSLPFSFLPTAYKVWGRLCFHRRLSFCPHFGGWVSYLKRGGCLVWGEADPPPPLEMATAAVGTHPTGMHTCFLIVSTW